MADASDKTPAAVSELCGYRVLEPLGPKGSYLATASDGRKVVLKKLPAECLLRGQLHPQVHDRLKHVRELAHMDVASLCGVERERNDAYLVWEYLEGVTLEQYLIAEHPGQDLVALARELALTVEWLHELGIVHGALHGRNVIVQADQRLRLTHLSPLLYYNPAEDVAALIELLRDMASRRHQEYAPLGRLTAQVRPETLTLRQLADQLAILCRQREAEDELPGKPHDAHGISRRAYLAAALTAAAGIALGCGIWLMTDRNTVPAPSTLQQRIVRDEPR